jgi:hypothetical protein
LARNSTVSANESYKQLAMQTRLGSYALEVRDDRERMAEVEFHMRTTVPPIVVNLPLLRR